MTRVARISISPVKGFRLSHPVDVMLGPNGVEENRRFFLVDAAGPRLRSSRPPWPVLIQAHLDTSAELLRMYSPHGSVLAGDARPQRAPTHSPTGRIDLRSP